MSNTFLEKCQKLSNEIRSGSAGAGTVSPGIASFNSQSDGNNQLYPLLSYHHL